MHFGELAVGDYKVYAGALEAPAGGYFAAVVVNRTQGVDNRPREAFRDTQLAGGHRWDSPDTALQYALVKGREIVCSKPALLAC